MWGRIAQEFLKRVVIFFFFLLDQRGFVFFFTALFPDFGKVTTGSRVASLGHC